MIPKVVPKWSPFGKARCAKTNVFFALRKYQSGTSIDGVIRIAMNKIRACRRWCCFCFLRCVWQFDLRLWVVAGVTAPRVGMHRLHLVQVLIVARRPRGPRAGAGTAAARSA